MRIQVRATERMTPSHLLDRTGNRVSTPSRCWAGSNATLNFLCYHSVRRMCRERLVNLSDSRFASGDP